MEFVSSAVDGAPNSIDAPAPVRISARFFKRLGTTNGPCDRCSTLSAFVDLEPILQFASSLDRFVHLRAGVVAAGGDIENRRANELGAR